MNSDQLIASLRYCEIEPLEIDRVNNRFVFVNLSEASISNWQIDMLRYLGLNVKTISLSFMQTEKMSFIDTIQMFLQITDLVEAEQIA